MAFRQYRPSGSGLDSIPPVIKNIIIINCLMLLAATLIDERYNNWFTNTFALHYFKSELFKPWQIITHIFMHGSIGHLFFNMFSLWMLGRTLENFWGSKKFLNFYMICGIGAALLHMGALWYDYKDVYIDTNTFLDHPTVTSFFSYFKSHPPYDNIVEINNLLSSWQLEPNNSNYIDNAIGFVKENLQTSISTPTVGASGAVFGILAAFGYLFPNTELYIYGAIPVKAKYFVMGYAALEIYLGFQNSAGDNVAHWAHIGGALFGFLLVYYWNKTNRKTFY